MPANDEQKSPIQVIDRMMRLLDVLAQHPEPLGLKQISQITGLHPSTAHRILSAMSADRIVDRVEPGSYRLGMRLLELGNLVKSRISVGERAPLHVTAAGKLFLLEEGFARLRDYAKRTGLAPQTRNTLDNILLLERD